MVTSRTSDVVVLVVFLAILALPALVAVVGGGGNDSVTVREQRQRAPWPAPPRSLAALKRLPVALQRWFDDRFGLREPLILLHNGAKAMAGVAPSDKVVIGRDGWLFIEQSRLTDANRGALPFEHGEIERLLDHFLAFQARLQQSGIAYLQFTPPDKQSVHADKLPSRLRAVGPSRYDTWRAAAAASPLNFIDIYPAIAASRDAGEYPYLQTDSHWNCRGAFVAYVEVMAALQRFSSLPLRVLTPAEIEFERVSAREGRDLARNVVGIPALFPEGQDMRCTVAAPLHVEYLDLETGRALSRRELDTAPRASRVINHGFPAGARAIVVRDSYSNAMIDYLNQSFGEVVYLYRVPEPPDADLIRAIDPDVVLYEHVERSLVSYSRQLARAGTNAER